MTTLPDEAFVSVITLAELHAGVLAANDNTTRSRRMRTLDAVGLVTPLPVDVIVAAMWALQRVQLRDAGRRADVNDLWIAATAAAADLPVFTQDEGFRVFHELGLVDVVLV